MVERQTAVKVSVKWLLEGEYVQKEGWEPNYVRTCAGDVSRVNVMGVLTQSLEPGSFVLDDGTGSIQLRTFEEKLNFAVGTPVMVIGRPRVYAGEFFINYEILKRVKPEWLEFRKRELGATPTKEVEKQPVGEEVIVKTPGENLFSKIMDVIRTVDEAGGGQGADVEEVIKQADNKEAEHIVKSLLEEGEVFEIRPGKIKILE